MRFFGNYRIVNGEMANTLAAIEAHFMGLRRTYIRHMLLLFYHYYYDEQYTDHWIDEISDYFADIPYVKGSKGNQYPNWKLIYSGIYEGIDDQYERAFNRALADMKRKESELPWQKYQRLERYKQEFRFFIRSATETFAKIASTLGEVTFEQIRSTIKELGVLNYEI